MRQSSTFVLIALALTLSACGGSKSDSSNTTTTKAVAQQLRPEDRSMFLTAKRQENPLEKLFNQFIQTAYAAVSVSIPNLSFGTGDVKDTVYGYTCNGGSECTQYTQATGCSAIDHSDGVALAPLTAANGQNYGIPFKLIQGTKFLVNATAFFNGSSVGTKSKQVAGGAYIDINKPVTSANKSACNYTGVAVTSNWSFALKDITDTDSSGDVNASDTPSGTNCGYASIYQQDSNGSVVIEVTGNGGYCALIATGTDADGAISKTTVFNTVPPTDAPVIDKLLFDTDELPLDTPVTVNVKAPKYPVTSNGSPAMQFEVVSGQIQTQGTRWIANHQIGTNMKQFNWVIGTDVQTVLLSACKSGSQSTDPGYGYTADPTTNPNGIGCTLSQTKFILIPDSGSVN